MPIKPTSVQQQVKKRSYIARDFDGFRASLLDYARTYYPERINDFSENSLGGLFLELASYVGDNLSFYLDHQFNELDSTTATETVNIQRALAAAGVPVVGASPARVTCTFSVEVPAISNPSGGYMPDPAALPVIGAGTTIASTRGVQFTLLEALDFSKKVNEKYTASVVQGTAQGGVVLNYIMSFNGVCMSGQEDTYDIDIGNFVAYRKITLPSPDIYEIINVTDGFGNTYYEVNDLAEDVVYKSAENFGPDLNFAQNILQPVYAPYRYTKSMDISSRLMTLTFGGGSALSQQDDVIPDPSDFALSLPFTSSTPRTAINPQKMLSTRTLGVAAENTVLSVRYRYGGGLSHNVAQGTITSLQNLVIKFPQSPPRAVAGRVVNSISVSNQEAASGGENAPTVSDLKALIPSIKNSQQRIVTSEDLLARVYTLPSGYGRVFRAGVRPNPDNPMAIKLFVVSRDINEKLAMSSDTLKLNLAKHLNDYRMVTDAIDVYDARIINLQVKFRIVVDPRYNANLVISDAISQLTQYFETKNWYIDKPVIISDVIKLLFSVDGVVSLPTGDVTRQNDPNSPLVFSASSSSGNRRYSDEPFSVQNSVVKGMLVPPEGGIFEVKYPEFDITGESM